MPQKFQTTFIPNKPTPTVSNKPVSLRRGGSNIFLYTSIIIFVVSVAAAAWSYLAIQVQERNIEELQANIARLASEFDQGTLNEMQRLNNRLNFGSEILDSHVAASIFFDWLQVHTLKFISFNSFDIERTSDGGRYLMNARGEAQSFASIVALSDRFSLDPNVNDLFFSSVEPNPETGLIDFVLEGSIDSQLFLFSKGLSIKNEIDPSLLPGNSRPASTTNEAEEEAANTNNAEEDADQGVDQGDEVNETTQ